MDDFIFEEFKGTGNMEIHLSRSLAENRVFPAIDLKKSSTRKDELLLSEEEFKAVNKLRRIICKNDDATEMAIDCIERTKSNADLIAKIDDWINLYNR
jgi:transcription termination factor Rho